MPRPFATLFRDLLRVLLVVAMSHVTVSHVAVSRVAGAAATRAAATPPEASVVEGGESEDVWTGGWIGEIRPVGGRATPIHVAIERGATGRAARVHALPLGVDGRSAVVVEVEAPGSAGGPRPLQIDLGGGRGLLELELAADGSSCRGSFSAGADPAGARAALVELVRVDLVEALPACAVHAATLALPGASLELRLAIGRGPHGWCGSIDVPAQGIRAVPARIRRDDEALLVELPFPAPARIGLRLPAGVPPTDESFVAAEALEGEFAQAGFRGSVRFERQAGLTPPRAGRPQDPSPPFPYVDEEVRIPHPAGHALAGTLSIPHSTALASERGLPAIVLATGSGPQDRDEAILGHRPFAVLADALARAGMAVLRCDDRGVSSSTGSFAGATSLDLASDLDAAFGWLARRPGVDPARIGILGHSEGGLLAPVVAAWRCTDGAERPAGDRVAFLVLLAPPGEPCGALLVRQNRDIARVAGASPEEVDRIGEAMQAVVDAVVSGARGGALAPIVRRLLEAQLAPRPGTPLGPGGLEALVGSSVQAFEDPWMVAFLSLDPNPYLERVEVPTLAVWGTLDLQVDAVRNGEVLDAIAARSGAPIETRTLEGLNHLLQPARTGAVDEYGAIEVTIDPAALAGIVGWTVRTAAPDATARPARPSRPVGWSAPPIAPRPAVPSGGGGSDAADGGVAP